MKDVEGLRDGQVVLSEIMAMEATQVNAVGARC